MKNKKSYKLLSLLLALIFLLGMLPTAAFAKSSAKQSATTLSGRQINTAIRDISNLVKANTNMNKIGKKLTIDLDANKVTDSSGKTVSSIDKVLKSASKLSYTGALRLLDKYDYLDVVGQSKAGRTITVLDPYQTRRILVSAKKLTSKDVKGSSDRVDVAGANLHILQYSSEKAAISAYSRLKSKYGSHAVLDRTYQIDDASTQVKTAGTISTKKMSGETDYMSWGVKDMGLDKMQDALNNLGKTLPSVTVAVIDTGINFNDSIFDDRTAGAGFSFVRFLPITQDVNGHGTNVSGIICDCTTSNVKILPVQTINATGSGTTLSTYLGLLYAVKKDPDVVNMSIAATADEGYTAYDSLLSQLVSGGSVICVAAGNEAADVSTSYPSRSDNVICIGATTSADVVDTSYSNTGKELDFVAPGTEIYGAYVYLLQTARASLSGTSMAAPHASGAAALLKTCNKDLTQAQVYSIFQNNSEDLYTAGFDTTSGYGKINLTKYAATIK